MRVIYNEQQQKIPIKLWLEDIEDSAMAQANNLANLPFAFRHIVILPDCHMGYGMPIGGVLAVKNVVIPNAVGVDIGCVDRQTEFLSPFGWKKISEYNGEKVMQFNPRNNEAKFVKPLRYIKEKCDKFIKIKTKYGIDQMLSEEHRCLIYKYNRKYDFEQYETISAKEIYNKHTNSRQGFRHRFLTTFIPRITTSLKLTNDEIRVMTMFCADGCISRNSGVINFKKLRKTRRAIKILKNAHIPFSKNRNNQVTTIRFKPPILKKGIEQFWEASYGQLKIISEEVLYWDGNKKEQCFYTRKKEEADFINYVFSATGFRSTINIYKKNNDKLDYRVFRFIKTKVGINGTPKTEIKIIKKKDFKYCFTVPSSFLILRRNGCVFITGNCGMCALKTSLQEISIEQLKKIMGRIRQEIPTGFNRHKEPHKEYMPLRNFSDFESGLDIVAQEFLSACKQIGTLGGGNHFIEIQKGSDGYIWVMIHSGSRNLGLKVANYYNKIAKELNTRYFSSVPKEWDLAFLPLGSKECNDYLLEMEYCLDFAFANRKFMMEKVKKIIGDLIGKKEFFEPINIHHNYATMENHFGQNVMIHRKGATSAKKDQLGIIPGSQGSKSYIVEGLGNPESFMSCSHGAGRKMGRKQAKKTLNLEEEKKKLDDKGILHAIRGIEDLDEASGAYKDIEIVMENQKDLVRIVVELEPLGVIKA